MGISGLLPMLKSIQRPCNLKKFSGLTLGVDAYVWLHRGAYACAMDVVLEKPTSRYLDFAMHRVRMLMHYGITPYVVFDGDYLPSKAGTESGRAEKRRNSKNAALALHHRGDVKQAHAEFQKAVDITPEMAGQFIRELQKQKISYVVAPYEADAQLAYLERKGIIQGVISEDSDLLVFGCQRLLTKLDQYGDCVEVNRDDFAACTEVSLAGWTDSDFRHMAILSGCDYLVSVKGLGLKVAYRLLRKFKTVDKVVQRLRFDTKYQVPTNYLDEFHKADFTFRHQWVFCPTERKLVRCTDPTPTDIAQLGFLGPEIDDLVAAGVAAGRLHPTTKQPLVITTVGRTNRASPWASKRPQTPSTPLDAKLGKSIDTFFKPRRIPLAELDPNSFTPSPSQRQLQESGNRTWRSSPVESSRQLSTPVPTASMTAEAPRARQSLSATPSQRQRRDFGTQNRPTSPVSASPQLPTLNFSLPVTTGTSQGRSVQPYPRDTLRSFKRQRLCGEEGEKDGANCSQTPIKSKFFSSNSDTGSDSFSKQRSRTIKGGGINIWSDDSIDGIMADIPDLSRCKTSKVKVYTEIDQRNQNGRVQKVTTELSSLSQYSNSTASTAGTSMSLLGLDGMPSVPSASDRPTLTGKSQQSNQAGLALHTPGKETGSPVLISSLASPEDHTSPNLKASGAFYKEQDSIEGAELLGNYKEVVPNSPVNCSEETAESATPAYYHSSQSLLGVMKSVEGGKGSEDLLVPQSEDEEAVDYTDALPAPKLDLSRFRFSG